jgi:hypothetical protein
MDKSTALFFFSRDAESAKRLAAKHRKTEGPAFIRDAAALVTSEPAEPVEVVFVLPCVADIDTHRIAEIYGDKVKATEGIPPPPPAAPPPPGDALATLSADWQTTRSTKELKQIAASISGRAVENRVQAVEVIEAEVARRTTPFPLPPVPGQ